jgi:hypothetical protein
MSEKSRLYRTGKEINHSIKTQQHDFEVFHAREFELVVDGLSAFLQGESFFPFSVILVPSL